MRLSICLVGVLLAECFDRLHQWWNVSEESVQDDACYMGFVHVELLHCYHGTRYVIKSTELWFDLSLRHLIL